jgi:hypothetical protein
MAGMGAGTVTQRIGGGPQVRSNKGKFTTRTKGKFLAELARTMNVAAASRAVGVSESAAYALRKREPAFAEAWAEALSDAYGKVEMLLLQRAIAGLGGDEDGGEQGEIAKLEKLSERTLMAMLGHHRQAVQNHRAAQAEARGIAQAAEESSARKRLADKLAEMERRLLGQSEPAEAEDDDDD